MKSQNILGLYFLLLLVPTAHADQSIAGKPLGPAVELCDALAAIGPGDRLPLSLEGVYWVGPEHQLFYDLDDPLCDSDLQPLTWVEFDDSFEMPAELATLLARDSRAKVTFRGILFGPKQVPADDPTLPLGQAYMRRTSAAGRYGHLGKYRTELVVSEALDILEVPPQAPGPARSFASRRSPFPKVVRAEIPTVYPKRAGHLNVEGKVIVEIELKRGNKVAAKIVFADDRLLVEDTLANIETWQFEADAEATFITTFVYRFDRSLPSSISSVQVHAELPTRVEIIAPKNDW